MDDMTNPIRVAGYVTHADFCPEDGLDPVLTVRLAYSATAVPLGAVTIVSRIPSDAPDPRTPVNQHPRRGTGMTVSELIGELEARALSGGGDVPAVVEGIRDVRGVMIDHAPGEDGRLVVVLS